jgi:hypothetical protein
MCHPLLDHNSPVYWLHRYIVHLMSCCCVPKSQVIKVAVKSAENAHRYYLAHQPKTSISPSIDPAWRSISLSDNECVMVGQRWFYKYDEYNDLWSVEDRDTKGVIYITINWKIIANLIAQSG